MHKKKAGKLQTGSTFPKQYWLAVNGKPKIEELVAIRDKLEARHLSNKQQIEKIVANKEKSENENSERGEEILEKGMVKILHQINNFNNICERLNLGEKTKTQTSGK